MSDVLCPMPFIHVNPSVAGYYRVCCNSPHQIDMDPVKKTSPTTVKTKSCKQVFDNQIKNVREQMLKGERPIECKVCWDVEDKGARSMRQIYKSAKSYMDLVDYDNPALRYLDIKFDNNCNLECRMCDPSSSKKHWNNFEHYIENDIPLPYMWQHLFTKGVDHWEHKRDRDYNQDLKKQYILEVLPTLRILKVTGGEPFMSKDFYDILTYTIKHGYAKNLTIKITTNGTKFIKKYLKLFEHFKTVRITLSIDGTEKIYDYIRYPFTWSKVKGNIHKLAFSDNIEFQASCIVSVYNWLNLSDIFKIFKDLDKWIFFDINCRPNVSELNIKNLPNHLLEEGLMLLNKSYPYYDDIEKNVKTYFNKQDHKTQKKMKETTVIFDQLRNQSYNDFLHPKLTDWLNTI